MNKIFLLEFLVLANRYKKYSKTLNIKPQFGYFFNFCLNIVRLGQDIRKVYYKSHIEVCSLLLSCFWLTVILYSTTF